MILRMNPETVVKFTDLQKKFCEDSMKKLTYDFNRNKIYWLFRKK